MAGIELVPMVKNHCDALLYSYIYPNSKSILLIFLNSIIVKHTTKISKKKKEVAELRLNQSKYALVIM